jgi:hypothetical protein
MIKPAGRNTWGIACSARVKVNLPTILAMMEGRKTSGLVMLELDSTLPSRRRLLRMHA